jgi:hypothetical protein
MSGKNISALLFFMLTLSVSHVVNADCLDAAEPNNDPSSAFSCVCDIFRRVPVQPTCIDTPDDVDYFSFSVADNTSFRVAIDTFTPGSSLDSMLTLYDTDGITVLKVNEDEWGNDPCISNWFLTGGTYFFSIQSQDGSVGEYQFRVACLLPDNGMPQPIGNTLKLLKETEEKVLLKWVEDNCGDYPATHFNVYRADLTTPFVYDQIAEPVRPEYESVVPDPDAPIYYFQVQSENPNGVGDLYPAFAKIILEPAPGVFFDLNQQISADPCERPNQNSTLPIDFRVTVLDRFDTPVDGIDVVFRNSAPFLPLGGFCPWSPLNEAVMQGVTGTDGPGAAVVTYTMTEVDRTIYCLGSPDQCIAYIDVETVYGNSNTTTVYGVQ